MNFDVLIEKIARDGRYLTLCYKLTNGNNIAKDLWQDTILSLYSSKERVLEVYQEGNLEVFIVGVINNLYGKRNRVKRTTGSTSNLYMYADNLQDWQGYKEHLAGNGNERYLMKQAVNELNKKMHSEDADEAKGAELVWKVCNSNVWQVSKSEGVNHMRIKRTVTKVVKQIKRKLDE